MNKKMLAAAIALATMGGYGVYAEDLPVYTLDAVVVTAARTPEKAIDANANVDVVTAKDIEQHHYQNVTEAIRKVSGVVIANRGANGQSSMSDQVLINGSENVVIMIDGMRMNTNGNGLTNTDIGTFSDLSSVDRIEVLKGSASTLYGSDAQGGVINIITKKPEDGTMKTKVGASFGSYDGEKYNFYHEGAQDGFFWVVNAQKQLQGNYKDGWGRTAINHLNAKSYGIKLGKDLGNDSALVFQYQKYKSDYTRPDSGTNDTLKDSGKKDDDRISLQYKAKLSDHLDNQLSIYRNQTRLNDNYNNPLNTTQSGRTEMTMRTTGISDQITYSVNNQTIIGGFDWYKDEVPSYKGTYFVYTPPTWQQTEVPISGVEGKSITNTAFYIQDKINLTEQWNVTPGVRVDHNSQFGNHTSPSLAVGYKANEKTNYYASYKEFFVAPNLYQLYHPAYGSTNLDPAEGYTVEFGVNHQFDDSLSGSLSVFKQHAKNNFGWSGAYRYTNTGEMDQKGINLSLNKTFDNHFSANVGYSYISADMTNDVVSFLPKHKVNVDLNYTNDALSAYVSGIGIMDRYAKGVMKDYSSFWVWNIGANYQVTKNAEVYARVNNLFNQFYTDIGGSYNSPTGTWYSAPGRNYEVGVSFQF